MNIARIITLVISVSLLALSGCAHHQSKCCKGKTRWGVKHECPVTGEGKCPYAKDKKECPYMKGKCSSCDKKSCDKKDCDKKGCAACAKKDGDGKSCGAKGEGSCKGDCGREGCVCGPDTKSCH